MLGICPLPGRGGSYAQDLSILLGWNPSLVLSMTTLDEMTASGAAKLTSDLGRNGVEWRHLPVADMAAQSPALSEGWGVFSIHARRILGDGGRVLVHCMAGCGRSGMAVLRLMVEAGEAADMALARLRGVRPCAVETTEQSRWATTGGSKSGSTDVRDVL